MAWNPSPEVQVARDAASKLGELGNTTVEQVMIVYITSNDKLGLVTYGQTKQLCHEAKLLGDELYRRVMQHYEGTL